MLKTAIFDQKQYSYEEKTIGLAPQNHRFSTTKPAIG